MSKCAGNREFYWQTPIIVAGGDCADVTQFHGVALLSRIDLVGCYCTSRLTCPCCIYTRHQHKHSARKKITCTESVSRIIRKERLFRILGAITSGAKSAQIARGFIFLITQYLPRQLFIFQKGNLISGPKCWVITTKLYVLFYVRAVFYDESTIYLLNLNNLVSQFRFLRRKLSQSDLSCLIYPLLFRKTIPPAIRTTN